VRASNSFAALSHDAGDPLPQAPAPRGGGHLSEGGLALGMGALSLAHAHASPGNKPAAAARFAMPLPSAGADGED
jgi:hypothetical protein